MKNNFKFEASKQDLSNAFGICIKTVSNISTIPLLGCFELVAKNHILTIRSTNSSEGTEVSIPIYNNEIEGTVIINAHILTELVKKISNDMISFSCENGLLIIEWATSRYRFKLLGDDVSFPVTPKCTKSGIKLNGLFLKSLVERAGYAVDGSSIPMMGGVCLTFSNDGVRVVSIDGKRFAMGIENIEGLVADDCLEIVIEANALLSMVKTLKNDEDVELIVDGHSFYMVCQNVIHNCRLLEGEVFDITRIIPTGNHKMAIYDASRLELIGCTERSMILSNENNNLLRFTVENERMTITTNSHIGKTNEEMAIANSIEQTDPYVFGINGKYLLEALKHFKSDKVNILSTATTAPILITSNEIEDQSLIMPVRLAKEA